MFKVIEMIIHDKAEYSNNFQLGNIGINSFEIGIVLYIL